MTRRTTTIHPWGAVLHLATDRDAYEHLCRGFDLEAQDAGGAAHLVLDTSDRAQVYFVVWIEPRPDDPVGLIRTAVHESVHVAAMLLDHVGTTLHGESETLAYLSEWLVGWMMRHLPHDTAESIGA
jgi:hypothetical protein